MKIIKGHQPIYNNLDKTDPPKGGSGVNKQAIMPKIKKEVQNERN